MSGQRRLLSSSPEETRALGRLLGGLLRGAMHLFLVGEMGAGKTCFTQGLGEGLKGEAELFVSSPSYTLMNLYPGRLDLYHFDLFRLHGEADLEDIGFSEYLGRDAVVAVEWADRIDHQRFEGLHIRFAERGENCRELIFGARGAAAEELLELFFQRWEKENHAAV
ncbi:MAG: tRNA (adenosine(37)-N6)-threonylcarbamoyltransferase complex ATPase subunit type 1 TsaE [Deltaproteobacteria bacterium]|nr:tRNA (adenosine(37)-N6)-threonylcarbamoyltransferase complex ATPase subunit type 1 TsaE [Deltaproteobacteria bacterium]